MNKVTVIGAGNVGATVAECVAHKDMVNEVVLIDIKEVFRRVRPLILQSLLRFICLIRKSRELQMIMELPQTPTFA